MTSSAVPRRAPPTSAPGASPPPPPRRRRAGGLSEQHRPELRRRRAAPNSGSDASQSTGSALSCLAAQGAIGSPTSSTSPRAKPDQLPVGVAAHPGDAIAQTGQPVEHGGRLRPGGDVAGEHDPGRPPARPAPASTASSAGSTPWISDSTATDSILGRIVTGPLTQANDGRAPQGEEEVDVVPASAEGRVRSAPRSARSGSARC